MANENLRGSSRQEIQYDLPQLISLYPRDDGAGDSSVEYVCDGMRNMWLLIGSQHYCRSRYGDNVTYDLDGV